MAQPSKRPGVPGRASAPEGKSPSGDPREISEQTHWPPSLLLWATQNFLQTSSLASCLNYSLCPVGFARAPTAWNGLKKNRKTRF